MHAPRTPRTFLAVGLVSVALAPAALAPASDVTAGADGDNGVYTLTLTRALLGPKGAKPLTIHLERRDGEFTAAIGTARLLNVAPHDVDASGLKLAGGRLAGRVKVTVNPDNWFPADGKALSCAFAIDAAVRGGAVTGTFTGTCGASAVKGSVAGSVGGLSALPDPARLKLVLERGLSSTSRHWGNRVYVELTIRRGRAVAPKVFSPNNTTYADFTCQVDRVDWRLDAGRFTCLIAAAVTGKGFCQTGKHTFSLDGRIVGDAVAGQFVTRRGAATVAAGKFVGTVGPAAVVPLADCTYELHMHEATQGPKAMWVHLRCAGGAFGAGLAFTPQFNHAVHEVDASGLKLTGRRMEGELKVTVNADPYVPRTAGRSPARTASGPTSPTAGSRARTPARSARHPSAGRSRGCSCRGPTSPAPSRSG